MRITPTSDLRQHGPEVVLGIEAAIEDRPHRDDDDHQGEQRVSGQAEVVVQAGERRIGGQRLRSRPRHVHGAEEVAIEQR